MSKRILTVDDSRTMREMVAMTLRNAGFHVIQADDGVNALKVLADNEVDIIITDLNMPNMDGLQLVRALRAKPEFKGTPILFLTTRNTDTDKQQGRAAGCFRERRNPARDNRSTTGHRFQRRQPKTLVY